jgi:hypothetical protein
VRYRSKIKIVILLGAEFQKIMGYFFGLNAILLVAFNGRFFFGVDWGGELLRLCSRI